MLIASSDWSTLETSPFIGEELALIIEDPWKKQAVKDNKSKWNDSSNFVNVDAVVILLIFNLILPELIDPGVTSLYVTEAVNRKLIIDLKVLERMDKVNSVASSKR